MDDEGFGQLETFPPPADHSIVLNLNQKKPRAKGSSIRSASTPVTKLHQGRDEKVAGADETVSVDSETSASTVATRKTRSMAPPDELRYGDDTEAEMQRKDAMIDHVAVENSALEQILSESREFLQETATHFFVRHVEAPLKGPASNSLKELQLEFMDRRGNLGMPTPAIQSSNSLMAAASKSIRPFTPDTLGLRRPLYNSFGSQGSSPSPSVQTPTLRRAFQGMGTRNMMGVKTMAQAIQQRCCTPNTQMRVLTGQIDYAALLADQKQTHQRNVESGKAYDEMLKRHFRLQNLMLHDLALPESE